MSSSVLYSAQIARAERGEYKGKGVFSNGIHGQRALSSTKSSRDSCAYSPGASSYQSVERARNCRGTLYQFRSFARLDRDAGGVARPGAEGAGISATLSLYGGSNKPIIQHVARKN